MKLYKQYVLQALITLAMMFLFACEKDPEQHLELGNWYLQKGLIDDAITEYREVSRLLPPDHSKLDREQFKILGTAHFKLALSYTKKGWWEYALREAENSFDLSPSPDTHQLVELIKEKITLQNKNEPSNSRNYSILTRSNSFGTERTENRAKEEDFITGPRETGLGEKKPPEHLLRLSTTNLDTNSNPKRNDQPEMTKNNEDEDGDLDNKKRKEIKDFAIWFNRTEKQNQEKRKKDLKRKRELEQNAPGGSRMKNGLGKSDMQLTRQLLSNPEPSYSPSESTPNLVQPKRPRQLGPTPLVVKDAVIPRTFRRSSYHPQSNSSTGSNQSDVRRRASLNSPLSPLSQSPLNQSNFISNFPMRQRNPSQQSPVPSPASQNPVSPNPPMSPLLPQYPADINNIPHQIVRQQTGHMYSNNTSSDMVRQRNIKNNIQNMSFQQHGNYNVGGQQNEYGQHRPPQPNIIRIQQHNPHQQQGQNIVESSQQQILLVQNSGRQMFRQHQPSQQQQHTPTQIHGTNQQFFTIDDGLDTLTERDINDVLTPTFDSLTNHQPVQPTQNVMVSQPPSSSFSAYENSDDILNNLDILNNPNSADDLFFSDSADFSQH
jgi:tetratricopeptide (TPR) repeat protein